MNVELRMIICRARFIEILYDSCPKELRYNVTSPSYKKHTKILSVKQSMSGCKEDTYVGKPYIQCIESELFYFRPFSIFQRHSRNRVVLNDTGTLEIYSFKYRQVLNRIVGFTQHDVLRNSSKRRLAWRCLRHNISAHILEADIAT